MHRTQIYLTDEQRRRLDQRASDAGVPMAEVVRRILDEALDITTSKKARLRAVEESFGVLDDGETTDEFLARVRTPGGASARLRKLGLSD